MPLITRDDLSEHDKTVLDSIFNPYQIGGDIPLPEGFDAEIPQEIQDAPEEQTPEIIESTKIELEAIKLAEKGELDDSLGLLENAIRIAPNRPSLYNNRAQAYRLKGNDEAAMEDLNKAIDLSPGKGRTKCQALCQRGVLYRKKEIIDRARADFEEAAKLGSKFARTQLIEMNPYAALCNQMLNEAFQKLS